MLQHSIATTKGRAVHSCLWHRDEALVMDAVHVNEEGVGTT